MWLYAHRCQAARLLVQRLSHGRRREKHREKHCPRPLYAVGKGLVMLYKTENLLPHCMQDLRNSEYTKNSKSFKDKPIEELAGRI